MAKVPEEFVTQRNTNANPPTFFLTLNYILTKYEDEIVGERFATFERLYPRLQVQSKHSSRWSFLNWFYRRGFLGSTLLKKVSNRERTAGGAVIRLPNGNAILKLSPPAWMIIRVLLIQQTMSATSICDVGLRLHRIHSRGSPCF